MKPSLIHRRRAIVVAGLAASLATGVFAQVLPIRPGYLGGRDFAAFQQAEIARWRGGAVRTDFKAEQ